ncbi:MFS general substrate transporter [Vararia minispora EC-137]|uniref:MFS general substrate transporter n=1 Tax=Vararia minispora EC-137 TaxID=1314806 RepID=A0ACB8QW06_9AGAM|nr:MFS general substrate transporter [Vararia minispora EC-137]
MTKRRSPSPSSEREPLLSSSSQTHAVYSQSPRSTSPEDSSAINGPLKRSRADLIWVLAGLWSAVFLGALDGTIVATLMTPIGNYFKKSNDASYIGTSYLLSVCCFTPLYGRLSDVLGRRGAMLLGLAFFGIGTVLCGLAPSMNVLIAARAIAGMGGGGVMTVSSIAVTDLIPLKQRGLYQGMANILFGLGAGLGGPLGGWLNDVFGWRSAFLFQIPVLAFSVILVAVKVNIPLSAELQSQTVPEKIRRMDFFGSATLAGTVGAMLLGFSLKESEQLPWAHPLIWGLFVASSFCAVLFIFVEACWAPMPVLPLRLITQRTPLAVCLSNLFGSIAAFSVLYNVPLYFSAVRMASSTNAGLHLLPHSIAISTGSVFAGWIMRRTGHLYYLTLGAALLATGSTTLIALWNDSTATWHLWLDIVPQALGMAALITTTLIAIIAGVSKADVAVATGITYLFRTTGQVLGVSLSGTVLQAVLLGKLHARIHGPDAEKIIASIRHSTSVIATLDPERRQAAISSYADALRVVFICQAVCNFLALLCTIPIQESPLPGTLEAQEEQFRRNLEAQRRQEGDA